MKNDEMKDNIQELLNISNGFENEDLHVLLNNNKNSFAGFLGQNLFHLVIKVTLPIKRMGKQHKIYLCYLTHIFVMDFGKQKKRELL